MPPRKRQGCEGWERQRYTGVGSKWRRVGEGQACDESDFYEFSEVDVGVIVEIDCGEDGMLAARLQRYM